MAAQGADRARPIGPTARLDADWADLARSQAHFSPLVGRAPDSRLEPAKPLSLCCLLAVSVDRAKDDNELKCMMPQCSWASMKLDVKAGGETEQNESLKVGRRHAIMSLFACLGRGSSSSFNPEQQQSVRGLETIQKRRIGRSLLVPASSVVSVKIERRAWICSYQKEGRRKGGTPTEPERKNGFDRDRRLGLIF